MSESVEIYVQNVIRDSRGDVVVVGIPNNQRSLKVGDVLTLRYEVSQEDVLKATPDPQRLNEAAISLTVTKIEAHRREVEELDYRTGAAGGLHLSGTGLELVTPRCFLRTA